MKYGRFETKQDYINSLLEMCEPLKKYYSDGNALLHLGETKTHYDDRTLDLEAFSRILWGLVPLWHGSDQTDFVEIYQKGIVCGTDKNSTEYWGNLFDGHQAFVEMAAMGMGLLLTPEKIWEPLDEKAKKKFNDWLFQINEYSYSRNNWQFFGVLVNLGLKHVGARYSQKEIDNALEIIEECYLGEGWYSDGKTEQRDYYISFAFHFYSLIYAKIMRNEDVKRSRKFENRAKRFAEDFIYWFAENGEALPFGRSLTYRFAQCGFFAALAFADIEVFSWGIMKGIVNRHMRSWWEKPIFDKEGLLTIGYAYPNLNMAEGYNGPGSPYWALKSFIVLALEDTHPFWRAKEEPLPELKKVKAFEHPRMIIQRVEKDHVIALTSGQYVGFQPNHAAEKYEKFAYSTYFGFSVPKSYYLIGKAVPDNMLAFEKEDMYYVRRRCEKVEVREDSIYSKWSPMSGISVETRLQPCGKGHVRTHTIFSEYDINAVECGFSIPDHNYGKEYEKQVGEACVENEYGTSKIQVLEGEGLGHIMDCEPNTNLIYPKTILPYIQFHIKKGTTVIKVYVEGIKGNK